MTSIKLGLIGDEPGPSSFLSAYLNIPLGSGAEVSAKKTIVIDGEHQTLEISSCQWQANTWLEIKNQTIKCSQGFMFICRPSGNAMKLRTIRKIIYSMMKVRGKIPLVVVSNELTSEASSSFDDSLIHLQTLFSALRCPILRTTAAKNDRMLAIMFADITKMVRKHDYSTDPKGAFMGDFESTIIRETDTHDDFFGASPTPLPQEQVVPQWGADHPSARSVLFGSTTTPAQASSAPSHASLMPYHSSSPNLSPPLGINLSKSPSSPIHLYTSESPRSDSPRRPTISRRNSEIQKEPRRTESPFRLELPESVTTTREASPTKVSESHHEISKQDAFQERKAVDPLAHLHEKMAATLAKVEKPTAEKVERLLDYSEVPSLRNAEARNVESPGLQFKHPDAYSSNNLDKGGEESGSPWDDSFNSSIRGSHKTRRETDSGKGRNSRPRKFPPVMPPHTPPPSPTLSSISIDQPLTEDVFEDMLPPDVKIQRAHLQQQIIARKAFLEKEAELEEITCKIVVIGAPKTGKTGFIENIAQTGSSYTIYKDGLEEGVSVQFDKHLQKNWRCLIIEPARERKVAFQLSMTNADAYVVLYNICSRQSFELLSTFFQEIAEAKGDLKGPIMLVGTKLDEVQSREVSREEGQKAAQGLGSSIIFHEISSKTHQNVHTCFPSLLNSFLLRKFKPMSPKGSLSPSLSFPSLVKTNSFDNRIKAPSTPNTPTTAPPNPFAPGSLVDSTEIRSPLSFESPSIIISSSNNNSNVGTGTIGRSAGEGKSSGKMLSNLCQSMREPNSGLKRKKKQFFTGADAIEWVVQKTQSSPQDSEIWCQKLMAGGYIRPIIMVDVSDVSISIDATRSKFVGGDELYLFEGDTSASNKVLNDRRTSLSGRPPLQIPEASLAVAFHSLHLFLRVKDSHYEVSYRDWEKSDHFDKFSLLASELQRVDYSLIKDEKCRLAFWINVHNVLAIHSCATNGPPYKEKKRKNFFEALYQVGDANVISIQDIFHGILRNNAKVPGASKRQFPDEDPRTGHVLPLDPRVYFALWHGTKSSPFLGIYGEDDVHVLLQYATHKYLSREVEMSYQKNYISLPKIFNIYANDFGKDINEVLLWISGFFDTEKAKLLKCIMHQDPDIRYKEYTRYEWAATPPELLFI